MSSTTKLIPAKQDDLSFDEQPEAPQANMPPPQEHSHHRDIPGRGWVTAVTLVGTACQGAVAAMVQGNAQIALIGGACLTLVLGLTARRQVAKVKLPPFCAGTHEGDPDLIIASGGKLMDVWSQQAAAVEEASASLHSLGASIHSDSENAKLADQICTDVQVTASSHLETVLSMSEALDTTTNYGQQMNAALQDLKASSGRISAIVKAIDEIAFQTNILALNAAVEAARSGEAGAGFAVVAEEVRNLARRSAEASRETAAIIQESIAKTDLGAATAEKVCSEMEAVTAKNREVAAGFQEIASKAMEAQGAVSAIASAMAEKTTAIDELNRAVDVVSQVTQENAARFSQ